MAIGVLALAGFAAAVAAFNLSLSGDYGRNPYVHASLVAWITLSYVLCGLTAWWRRPESRFGPLMVVAGFSPLLSRLSEADLEFLKVVGEGLLLLPPVLFLHVFLAYPSGRLERKAEQMLVLAGYTAIFGLDLARVVIEVTDRSGVAGSVILAAQRSAIISIVVGAIVVLVRRMRSTGRSARGPALSSSASVSSLPGRPPPIHDGADAGFAAGSSRSALSSSASTSSSRLPRRCSSPTRLGSPSRGRSRFRTKRSASRRVTD